MAPRAARRAGWIGSAALAGLLAVVVMGSGGCEALIGNDIPAYECGNGPAACPGEEVCDPSTRQCVAPCSQRQCASGTVCDLGSNLCVEPEASDESTGNESSLEAGGDADATTPDAAPETGPIDAGCHGLLCPCSGDGTCDSQICADSATVPPGIYTAAGNQSFCTQPCCTSSDCPAPTVCFAAGGSGSVGGNYCVDPAWLGRTDDKGTGIGGSSCTVGRGDCASALCSNGVCADTCCSTAMSAMECASGTICRFDTFPGAASLDDNFIAFCGQGGTHTNSQSCTEPTECQSELCNGNFGCANACRNNAECTGFGEACVYVNPSSTETGMLIAACFQADGAMPGNTPEGGSCESTQDCKSLFCDTNSNVCTDVCFADTDCTAAGWVCRPEALTLESGGQSTVLACGPPL